MIETLILQDKDNNTIGYIGIEELLQAIRDEQLNGVHTFKFEIDNHHQYIESIQKYNRILFHNIVQDKWYEFIIMTIEKNDLTTKITCESSIYDTLSNFIEFVGFNDNLVTSGLTQIFDACEPPSVWQVGTSDIQGYYNLQATKKNLKEVIWQYLGNVNGYIEERIEVSGGEITGRYIDILSSKGEDRGKNIYDDREINQINIRIPETAVYTAAFGYGASEDFNGDGETEQLDFSSIEWSIASGDPADKPLGQKWVGLSDTYKEQYGVLVGGIRKHKMTVFEDSNITDPETLLQNTYELLLSNIEDKTEYSIKAVDLKALGYETEEIRLGDTIGVVVSLLNTKIKAEIIRYIENYLEPEKNDFELANYAQAFTSRMASIENSLKKISAVSQAVSTQFLNNLLSQWNDEINSEGAYVYSNPENGLITYNALPAEATKVTEVRGGSIRIANTKVAGEWDWQTVLTGDGIIADAIYTGMLSGDKFELNLNTGTIKIGVRNGQGVIDEPTFYYDGSNLEIIGGTIKTSNGSNRIEIDSNNVKAYRNNIKRAELDYDSLNFFDGEDALAGSIVANLLPNTKGLFVNQFILTNRNFYPTLPVDKTCKVISTGAIGWGQNTYGNGVPLVLSSGGFANYGDFFNGTSITLNPSTIAGSLGSVIFDFIEESEAAGGDVARIRHQTVIDKSGIVTENIKLDGNIEAVGDYDLSFKRNNSEKIRLVSGGVNIYGDLVATGSVNGRFYNAGWGHAYSFIEGGYSSGSALYVKQTTTSDDIFTCRSNDYNNVLTVSRKESYNHTFMRNSYTAIKMLNTGSMVQVQCRNAADTAYSDFKAAEISYTSLVNYSDRAYKNNIKELDINALEILKNLKLYQYNYKVDVEKKRKNRGKNIGAMHDEVPELLRVNTASKENKEGNGIDITKIVYLSVKGIQELNIEIALLKEKINNLEKRLS